MKIPFPQFDLPGRISGASDAWDTDAGAIFSDEYFSLDPFSGFIDNFDDNNLDATKWFNWGGAEVVNANQQLEISILSGGANYQGIESVEYYRLRDSSVSIEVKNAGNQALTSLEVTFSIFKDTATKVFFLISGNNLIAYKRISNANVYITQTAYNSTTQKYLRIRESEGVTYWEYSGNGTSWTTLHSEATPFVMEQMKLELVAGVYATEATSTLVIYDNLNFVPVAGGTVNSARPSEIHGSAPANSSRPAEVHGSLGANSNRSSEVHGAATANANRPSEIHGSQSDNSVRPSEVHGSLSDASARAAEINVVAGANDDRDAEIHGLATDNSNRGAEVSGKIDSNSVRSTEITGAIQIASNRPSEISGIDTASSNRSSEISGRQADQSVRSAEIRGQLADNSIRPSEISGAESVASQRGAEIDGTLIEVAIDARPAEITGGVIESSSRGAEIVGLARPGDIRGDFTLTTKAGDLTLTRDESETSLIRKDGGGTVTHKGGTYGLTRNGGII